MIILALDALDKNMVERFKCKNLMQLEYGKTDLGGFSLERTVVLWASFLTGKNMESAIPIKGQWEYKLLKSETFFKFFDVVETIDVPAFSFKLDNHRKEHKLLAGYFKNENRVEDFNEIVWKNHEENKKDFFDILDKIKSTNERGLSKIIMGYFDLADAIGHLSFGDGEEMKKVYNELENLAGRVKKFIEKTDELILIISDHGMKPVGRYGDHSRNGFYSCNKKLGLNKPKIIDFYEIVKKMK